MDKSKEEKWEKTFGNIDTPATIAYNESTDGQLTCCVLVFLIFAGLIVGVIGMSIGEYTTYNDVRKDICRTVHTTLADYDKCIIEDIHNTVKKVVKDKGEI